MGTSSSVAGKEFHNKLNVHPCLNIFHDELNITRDKAQSLKRLCTQKAVPGVDMMGLLTVTVAKKVLRM